MASSESPLLSVVVPLYNEQTALAAFHGSLIEQLDKLPGINFELIYCNDGSTDYTADMVRELHAHDERVKLLSLTRNFGKEVALTAGINVATGEAVLMLDADGQHPVELIPEFVRRWQGGSKVVVGVRKSNARVGLVKRLGSKLFYGLYAKFTGMKLKPGSTDYRLIDKTVQQDFNRITQRNRITRGLIDWLGYEPDFIEFHAKERIAGDIRYSLRKLIKLAIDSAVSLSVSPLYFTAYLGAIVLPVSVLIGLSMIVDAFLGDPLNWRATGSAYIAVLLLFLVGVLMISQGIIGLYLSHIHTEAQNRPLYVVDKEHTIDVAID